MRPVSVIIACLIALTVCMCVLLVALRLRGARQEESGVVPITQGEGVATDAGLSYQIRGEWFTYPTVPQSDRLASMDWEHMARVHEDLLVLLSVWSEAASAVGLPWWIGDGSCLGWVRNRSLIPWDDDIDIHLSMDDLHLVQEKIIPYLKKKHPDFIVMLCFGWCLKVTRRSSAYTYLDIFVKVRDSGLWRTAEIAMSGGSLAPIWGRYYYGDNLPEHMLFPLKAVSFHGVPGFLPKDPEGAVTLQYGMDAIVSPKVYPAHSDGNLLARTDCVVLSDAS